MIIRSGSYGHDLWSDLLLIPSFCAVSTRQFKICVSLEELVTSRQSVRTRKSVLARFRNLVFLCGEVHSPAPLALACFAGVLTVILPASCSL